MKRRLTCIVSLLLTLLCLLPMQSLAELQTVHVPSLGTSFPFEGQRVVEPETTVQPDDLRPDAYGFEPAPPRQPHSLLLPGTLAETPLYRLEGAAPGPTVFVVGGTHGDERAGWYAGLLLRRIALKRGTLWLIPQANLPGCVAGERHLTASQDLNRAYPGDTQGDEAGRLAHAILSAVLEAKPDLLIDLHEAAYFGGNRAFLGQTLILGEIGGIEDKLFELMQQMEEPGRWPRPFSLEGPGIPGSLNSEAAKAGVPVFTVETFRGYELKQRVEDQLRVIRHFLKGLDMID